MRVLCLSNAAGKWRVIKVLSAVLLSACIPYNVQAACVEISLGYYQCDDTRFDDTVVNSTYPMRNLTVNMSNNGAGSASAVYSYNKTLPSISDTLSINIQGNASNGRGIYLNSNGSLASTNTSITGTGQAVHGVDIEYDSVASFGDKLDISVSGNSSQALYILRGSTVNVGTTEYTNGGAVQKTILNANGDNRPRAAYVYYNSSLSFANQDIDVTVFGNEVVRGIEANENSKVFIGKSGDAGTMTMKINGNDATGFSIMNDSELQVDNYNVDITAAGDSAVGISLSDGGTAKFGSNINGTGQVVINVNGSFSKGLYLTSNSAASFDVESLDIVADGSTSAGIDMYSNSAASFDVESLDIVAERGIVMSDGSAASFDVESLDILSDMGIYVLRNSIASFDAENLNMTDVLTGIQVSNNGTASFDAENLNIAAIESSSNGIQVSNMATASFDVKNLDISGVGTGIQVSNNGTASFDAENLNIASEATGIYTSIGSTASFDAENLDVTIVGKTAGRYLHGIRASANSRIDIGNETQTKVNILGNDSWGVRADGGSTILVAESAQSGTQTSIAVTGDRAYGVYVNNSTVDLGQFDILVDGHNSTALYVANATFVLQTNPDQALSIKTTQDDSYAIVADGVNSLVIPRDYLRNSQIYGNIASINGGRVAIMPNNTTIVGRTLMNLDTAGQITISNAQNFLWQLTGSSNLTQLSISNSIVDLTNNNAAFTVPAILTTSYLYADEASSFKQRLFITGDRENATNNGDLIKVTGTSSGNIPLSFVDKSTGSLQVDNTSKLLVVQQDNSTGSYAGVYSGAADLGAYTFNVTKGEGADNNWYLITKDTNSSFNGTKPGNNGTKPEDGPTPPFNNGASASLGFFHINYLSNFIETQTLLQRLGELRDKRGNVLDDVWIKAYGGQLSSFKTVTKIDDTSYYGIQAGGDRMYESDYGRGYLGLMLGYSLTDVSYLEGSGESKNYYGGLYGTFIFNSGTYIDLLAKYGKNSNEFYTVTSNKYAINGHGDTQGAALSLEAGHRLNISDSGFYIEPQVQAIYSFQDDMSVRTSNGLLTELDKYNSLLLRAGAILGYKINENSNLYYKAGYIKELDGDTSYSFNNGAKNKFELNSDIFDNALGFTYSFGQHNVYIEGIYQAGDEFDNIKGNVGYRWEF